jgi:DNA-binding transcriptional LysR family regulator
LFETEQEALELLSEVQVLKRGFLTIGADGPAYVIDLIGQYQEKYPYNKINLKTGNSSEVHAQLMDTKVDITIGGPVPEMTASCAALYAVT